MIIFINKLHQVVELLKEKLMTIITTRKDTGVFHPFDSRIME